MKTFKVAIITMILLITGGIFAAVFYFFYADRGEGVKVFLHFPEAVFVEKGGFFAEGGFVDAGHDAFAGDGYIEEEPEDVPCLYTTTIVLSAAGDTTLGGDRRRGGYHAFMREVRYNGFGHFFANVADIFYESDIAVVNLEGALTDVRYPYEDKEFVFRGPTEFAQILVYGNVNVVSLANNHTMDFFRQGYNDTRDALTSAGVAYFGNEFNTVMEINGITVGFFGHRIWGDHRYNRAAITRSIEYLRERGAQLIIAYYHWGVENDNFPANYQRTIGRFTIQEGAHLVLGAHPHVLQGIEQYEGRYIVHSLANFSFGGNGNPHDMDSFIFQQNFTFYRGELVDTGSNIIPIRVSSVRYRNNFQPTPAMGEDEERILARLETYSKGLLQ
ncbi:MAG: CapA family protein [Defluviitaleaceae bacterium]|nr:CapA family protein [Defluviitaleaceae bacterium]